MKNNQLSTSLLTIAFVMVLGSAFAPVQAPDASSTGLLLTAGFAGLAIVKRFLR